MTEWIQEVMNSLGYVGIFLLLILARMVPPVPAETVIPLAGIAAANGSYSLVGIAVAGGLGSAAGELFWYLPSRIYGSDRLMRFLRRHGHWLTMRPDQVDRATGWFDRHGGMAVLLCQPIPALRTMVSIPAGASGMPVLRFCLYAAVGSFLWTLVLAVSGYLLKFGWSNVSDYIDYFAFGLLAALLTLYIVRVIRQFRQAKRSGSG